MVDEKVKTLDFIEDYRIYQVLWDHKHKDYTNKLRRNEALISLSRKYKYDIKEVKNKIKSLRSYFSKEHQKVIKKKSDRTEDSYESSWFAYKSLLFILDSINPKDNIDNLGCTIDNSNTTSQEESTEAQASLSETTEHEFIQPLRKKRKVYKARVDEREEAYNIMKIASEKINSKDECDTIGQLIACKLRKLNPRNRLLAERRINDIFFELELEEIDSTHSVYSVAPPIGLSPATSTQSASTEDSLPCTDNLPIAQNTDKEGLDVKPFVTFNYMP